MTETSTGNAFTEHVSSLEINTDVAERMRVPGQNVHDATISGAGTTTVPLQIVNNHVYVTGVMLDGRGPYTFVLDSGGDYIVTPEVAAALHAASVGRRAARRRRERDGRRGVYSSQVDRRRQRDDPQSVHAGAADRYRLRRRRRLEDRRNARLSVLSALSNDDRLREREADPGDAGYRRRRLRPAPRPSRFTSTGAIPRISIQVDGVTTSAEVDTGNRAAIEFSAPFLAAHPQIAGLARTPPGIVGFGVGGPVSARLGRIPSLQIGPYAIANAIASFGDQSSGAFADPFNPANIGGSIWRRFDVTFDYAHQQLLLARNASFDDPFAYDRSGLFLIDKTARTPSLGASGLARGRGGLGEGRRVLNVNGTPRVGQRSRRCARCSPARGDGRAAARKKHRRRTRRKADPRRLCVTPPLSP